MFSDGSSYYVTGKTGHESESIEPCEQQDSSDLSSTSVSNDLWMKLLTGELNYEKWVVHEFGFMSVQTSL